MSKVPGPPDRFVMMPHAWALDPKVAPAEKAVLLALLAYRHQRTRRCDPSHESLADATGLTDRQVRRVLVSLRAKGIVSWESGGGRRVPNRYTLHDTRTPVSAESPTNPDIEAPIPGHLRPKTRTSVSEELDVELDLELDDPPSPPAAVVVPAGPTFEQWWARYPRKVGKRSARAAWDRVTRTTSPAVIGQGLLDQLPSMGQRAPQFVPHPTTWLNQGRWDDSPEATATAASMGHDEGRKGGADYAMDLLRASVSENGVWASQRPGVGPIVGPYPPELETP